MRFDDLDKIMRTYEESLDQYKEPDRLIIARLDGRIIPLPDQERVDDYFSWREEDANRNALNSWCYWTLREDGFNAADAQAHIKGKSIEEKKGWNPMTQTKTVTTRKELRHDLKWPSNFPINAYKFDID